MPITHEIIEEKNIILAIGSGVVTANDVISHLNTLAEDENYMAPMKKLVDYRTIENIAQNDIGCG